MNPQQLWKEATTLIDSKPFERFIEAVYVSRVKEDLQEDVLDSARIGEYVTSIEWIYTLSEEVSTDFSADRIRGVVRRSSRWEHGYNHREEDVVRCLKLRAVFYNKQSALTQMPSIQKKEWKRIILDVQARKLGINDVWDEFQRVKAEQQRSKMEKTLEPLFRFVGSILNVALDAYFVFSGLPPLQEELKFEMVRFVRNTFRFLRPS
jgi:hypothetical protein